MKTIARKNTINISISLSRENIEIVERLAKQEQKNKSSIFNKALSFYAQSRLEDELQSAYIGDREDNAEFSG